MNMGINKFFIQKKVSQCFIRTTDILKTSAKNLIIVVCLVSFQYGKAQQADILNIEDHKIVVMSRPQIEGKILLRWGTTTAIAWKKLNTYGYLLKRYTVTRDKNTLAQPVEKTIGVFKPKPLEEWDTLIDNNNNAAVMAQSLYGESFDIEGMDKLSAIVNLAEEQQQRYTWGLYVADQDYTVAEMAGLAYVDHDVLPNEKYLYKITSLVPEIELPIKEGGVFTGLGDYQKLPKPLDLAAIFTEQSVMLNWNYAIHNKTYNSYFVERSEDGETFVQLNKKPLTGLNNSDKTNAKRMFYLDSIVTQKKYYYRVLGKTPFGELSQPSNVVSGKSEKQLPYTPRITNKNYLDDHRIILEWEFLEEGNQYIKGFELRRSDKVNGKYTTVMKDIPPEARKLKYDSLLPTNYLTITAIAKEGLSKTSFPALVQPVDSLPPVKPIGFQGKVDSLGIVTLQWKPNTEKDILGYRVFRGNNKEEEFSQITVSPHQGTTYYDSISVKNLNTKVYYQLIAVDERFNMSPPSDVLELSKPDFIPPTPAVFKTYNIEVGKVMLSWANSSSADVNKHELYRKDNDTLDWMLIHTIQSIKNDEEILPKNESNQVSQTSYEDTAIEAGKLYSYTLIAIDKSGLESDPAVPLTVKIPKTGLKPQIQRLSSYKDKENGFIELFWKAYKEPNVAELMIYKGVKDQSVSLLTNVAPTTKRIVDKKVHPNNEYTYVIRAVFMDGTLSETAQLDIKY
ncbi:fibronectin type III domain-containing protein [Aquimarina pacifica]|uniref:fibronectin type III domain-containing protein n=1 Tax=Aquimarina pacifica TaxID=1296415 RepID=UPI0004B409C7|nr:hypothetical protein [Aquimarina pacifica]